MSQSRCKDSAKNRFSKEKENKLSFLSVRFLFKSKTKPNKKTLFLFFCWDAAYHTAPSAHKQSHSVPARFKHHYPHGRPRRINNRTSCVKQSQFYCVKYTRATPTGRELVCEYRPSRPGFKSSLLRREDLGERWSPLFKGKEGDGGWFSNNLS